ncbi:hypothetical protein EII18_08430 [Comamonadaceae bacterium OH3737_COT-264]|nr:hypothetical protein EII18_08430 [Comamonadaceae bacterium OH3737_COT-264]
MTTIAFDGKTLAADCMGDNAGIKRRVVKIERFGDALLAMTGAHDSAVELREWFKGGADPKDFPASAREDVATLIVFLSDGIFAYGKSPIPVQFFERKCAFGSGRDYAEAAMFLGCDAAKAVEVACHFDVYSGLGVVTLEF